MAKQSKAETKKVPPLRSLYLNTTRFCNLRCKHCWIAPAWSSTELRHEEMDLAFYKHLINDAEKLGLTSVKITGSEPFLYKNIFELCKHIKSRGLYLSIETNGTLIDGQMAKKFAKIGVNFISVSLDSADPLINDSFRGMSGAFERATKGARHLLKEGCNVQIIFSLVRQNMDELLKMPALVKKIGAGSLKINVVEDIARAKNLAKKGELLDVQENIEVYKKFEEKFLLPKHGNRHILYDIPIAFKKAGVISLPFDRKGYCSIHNILGVLPDGRASLCGIGFTTKESIVGDLTKESVQEIWKNSALLNLIRKDLPLNLTGICSQCIFQNFCIGKCVALNLYENKSHKLSFTFCQEAEELGLFPEKRKRANFLKT